MPHAGIRCHGLRVHPLRQRAVLEIMLEELHHADGEVATGHGIAKLMALLAVVEQPRGLAQPAHGEKHREGQPAEHCQQYQSFHPGYLKTIKSILILEFRT